MDEKKSVTKKILRYIGKKPDGTITVATVKRGHMDRIISFRAGQTWVVEHSISEQAARYLGHNFRALFSLEDIECDVTDLFKLELNKLIGKFCFDISDDFTLRFDDIKVAIAEYLQESKENPHFEIEKKSTPETPSEVLEENNEASDDAQPDDSLKKPVKKKKKKKE